MTERPARVLLFRWAGWFALSNALVCGLFSGATLVRTAFANISNPRLVTVTFPNGLYGVRDRDYRLLL
jgi:hypothetical protein